MDTSALRTRWDTVIGERTTPLLTLTIVDEAGQAIPSLSTLTLTLHKDGTVINARDRVNVLASFAAGTLSWRFEGDDTQILKATEASEVHTLLLEWSWDSGTRHGKHEIIHVVANLKTVPAA